MPTTLWDVIATIWRTTPLAFAGLAMLAVLVGFGVHERMYSLNGIKTRTVGNGQHGTARWSTPKEISETYASVPFEPEKWRRGENLPTDKQGLVLGCTGRKNKVTALVDTDDIHALGREQPAEPHQQVHGRLQGGSLQSRGEGKGGEVHFKHHFALAFYVQIC